MKFIYETYIVDFTKNNIEDELWHLPYSCFHKKDLEFESSKALNLLKLDLSGLFFMTENKELLSYLGLILLLMSRVSLYFWLILWLVK